MCGGSEEAVDDGDCAARDRHAIPTVSTAIRSARFANPDKNSELGDALLLASPPE
jgi:hypothetical protein